MLCQCPRVLPPLRAYLGASGKINKQIESVAGSSRLLVAQWMLRKRLKTATTQSHPGGGLLSYSIPTPGVPVRVPRPPPAALLVRLRQARCLANLLGRPDPKATERYVEHGKYSQEIVELRREVRQGEATRF
jgi:hypothetical protein